MLPSEKLRNVITISFSFVGERNESRFHDFICVLTWVNYFILCRYPWPFDLKQTQNGTKISVAEDLLHDVSCWILMQFCNCLLQWKTRVSYAFWISKSNAHELQTQIHPNDPNYISEIRFWFRSSTVVPVYLLGLWSSLCSVSWPTRKEWMWKMLLPRVCASN